MRWVALTLALAGCVDPRTAPHLAADRLAAVEDRLAVEPLRYDDPTTSRYWNPSGLYAEGPVLWVWSREHPEQRGFALSTLAAAGRRVGPRGTRRCVVGSSTVCVGDREPGGLVGFGGTFRSGLPARGGFTDVTADGDGWLVVDGVDRRLVAVGPGGAVRGREELPPGVTRIGSLGPGAWWLTGHLPPYLWVRREGRTVPVERGAPVRFASWDAMSDRLWLVGPAEGPVRRADGPMTGLYGEVSALDGPALRSGQARVVARFDLREQGLADPVAVAVEGDRVLVAATGSDAVWRWDGGVPHVERGCLGPAAVWLSGAHEGVACRLEDAVRVDGRRVSLDSAPRDGPVALGERLFYGDALWRQRGRERVTCNSCHWDTGTDHRVHPGFLERRWEVTRPLGGLKAVRPIFSTGGAERLSRAVEGLLRSLDHRLWSGAVGAWWEYPVTVTTKGGRAITLTAAEVREALLRFLMSLPVPPPVARAPGAPLSEEARRGLQHFERDCARCHRPSRSLRHEGTVADVPAALMDGPLVFGSAALADVGAGPAVTPNGHRVTPLMDLGRGGPWFTSGSARTLDEVLARFRPGSDRVHGAGPGGGYPPEVVRALRAFLLEL